MDAGFWDGIAASYAAKPVDDPDAFVRKQAVTRALLSPTDTVLEVGCGTGSLALLLADAAGAIHAMDVSGEMLRIAEQKREAQGVDNVTFHQGPFDGSFTVFEPESVDGLLAFSILHLLDDRPAALARMFALIRPGGWFVSSTACLGNSWVPYGPLLTVLRWVGRAPPVWVFDTATLRTELEQAGFIDIQQPDVGAAATVGFFTARKP